MRSSESTDTPGDVGQPNIALRASSTRRSADGNDVAKLSDKPAPVARLEYKCKMNRERE